MLTDQPLAQDEGVLCADGDDQRTAKKKSGHRGCKQGGHGV
jgi:hypothetical protein